MSQFYQFLISALLLLYWLTVASVTIRVVLKRRAVGVSVAWLLVIYILPVLGVIIYLLFGELKLGNKRALRAKQMFTPYESWFRALGECTQHTPMRQHRDVHAVHQLCQARSGIPSLTLNQLILHNTPEDILRSLSTDITAAQTSVYLEFYIWYPGGLADSVAQACIRAARRGVDVRILLDSAGSREFFKSHWPEVMRDAGIKLVEALAVSPFRMFFRRLDIRLHRKIVVIDNQTGYTGSMNLVDPRFFKQDAGVGQWVDVMVRITGPAVPVLNCIQAWDWEVETGERNLPEQPICPVNSQIHPHANHSVQVIPSGPGMPDGIIQQALLLSIYQARHSVTITTPYFVPSENMVQALKTLAQRGVKVTLIIPDKNDSLMVEWASRAFFEELMEAGTTIHRFHGGLLHTKSVMIDQSHCFIGTVNLDMRSFWLNFEVTLAVDDPEFCAAVLALQQSYLVQSQPLQLNQWKKRSLFSRPIEQFFYLFGPLL